MILKLDSLTKGMLTVDGPMVLSINKNNKYDTFDVKITQNGETMWYHDITEYHQFTDTMQLIKHDCVPDDSPTIRKHMQYKIDEDAKRSRSAVEKIKRNVVCTHIFYNEEHVGNSYLDGRVEYFPGHAPTKNTGRRKGIFSGFTTIGKRSRW